MLGFVNVTHKQLEHRFVTAKLRRANATTIFNDHASEVRQNQVGNEVNLSLERGVHFNRQTMARRLEGVRRNSPESSTFPIATSSARRERIPDSEARGTSPN